VRLKLEEVVKTKITENIFQFYSSAIKTIKYFLKAFDAYSFQFYSSAIKTFEFPKQHFVTYLFQFYSSAIKTVNRLGGI